MSSSAPCAKCLSFLAPKETAATVESTACCPVCLGLWDKDTLQPRLESAIRTAVEPYGKNNRFSSLADCRLIFLPGDVVYRYHTAARSPAYQDTATPLQDYTGSLKNHANNLLADCLRKSQNEATFPSDYPEWTAQEEQGYLSVNVVLVTPRSIPRPRNALDQNHKKQKRGRRKQFVTQGGHPRTSLERKIQLSNELAPLWTFNQAVELCEKQSRQKSSNFHVDWFCDPQSPQSIKPLPTDHAPLECHVALWRRPFVVQGRYTKTRRDVSQSPFFVADDNSKNRKRLGVTSIEELILPTLTKLSGGISTINNSPDNNQSNVLYGMAKFHASGREDMDVRMILPPTNTAEEEEEANGKKKRKITGRPFCCEMVDALRLPTVGDLEKMIHSINHNTGDGDESTLLPESKQYYGRSPMGVGVDPTHLSFAKGDDFKNLQGETEEKHKFYGCLCWSQAELPGLEELTKRLTTTTEGQSLFPLKLEQRTPIRVLHRRANAIRVRHVLSCHRVERLDDHYFRIHISTEAGTYVKEYCHGDLGRTQPNLSVLMGGGKIDILELDCEGIQQGSA